MSKETNLRVFTESVPSMSSRLDISVVWDASRAAEAHTLIAQGFAEADRLIGIISAWQEGTELYEVNRQAGIRPVRVGPELFGLLARSLKISELTDGLFDVTFASIDKVWYFDRPMRQLPTPEQIRESVRHIDYRHVVLDEKEGTVYIRNPKTKIELGAIGKGYIATRIKERLRALGVRGGLVNAGGDLCTWGGNERGEQWRVGIADPGKKEKYIAWLPLKDQAVATSGSYERFALIGGQKYSHIIHPKTGHPVKGLKSVTVLSADAELCDAVATSVFLLGREEGLAFVNRFDDIRCFIIDENDTYSYSDNLKQIPYGTKDT